MREFFAVILSMLFIASLILLVIGLTKPKKLPVPGDNTPFKVAAFYFMISSLLFLLFVVVIPEDGRVTMEKDDPSNSATVDSAKIKSEELLAIQKAKDDSILLRKSKIEENFSAWDGSHIGLTRFVKNNMNDPDSFDHIETRYFDNGDHLVVTMRFRGANVYGGKVINTIMAKVSIDGDVLEIIESGE